MFYKNTLTCKTCGKRVCSGHENEQYVKYTAGFISYNYPDGNSFDEEDFVCYQCRTGEIPTETSQPPSFFSTTKGIALIVILLIIISFSVWYSYEYINRDVYMAIDGYSGETTSENFIVLDEAEMILIEYNSNSDNPELTIQIYDSNTDDLIGNVYLDEISSGRAGKNFDLYGDTTLPAGEYYITLDNNGGYYKIQVVEKIL